MGYMIEITEDKVEKVSEHIEKALKYMGKAMQCIEMMMDEGEMGEQGERGGGSSGSRSRRSYGGRSMYGSRIEDVDEDDGFEERRGRRR